MKEFTAYYFLKEDNISHTCYIIANSRMDVINLFEKLYPSRRLVSLEEAIPDCELSSFESNWENQE